MDTSFGAAGKLLHLLLLCVVLVCIIPSAVGSPKECENAFLNMVADSKEALALMVDATGKSVDDLGKWDQCRDLGQNVSHYCWMKFALPISIPTPYIGLCFPSNCTAGDIANLTHALINTTAAKLMNSSNMEVAGLAAAALASYENFVKYQHLQGQYELYCPADTPSIGTSGGGITMLIISAFLGLLVLFGTLLDGYNASWWPDPVMEAASITVPPVGGIQDSAEVAPLIHQHSHRTFRKSHSKLFEFLVSFSLARNFKSLVGPSPPALAFLNGMRAISITWVILGHSLDYMNYAGVLNFAHVVTKDIQNGASQVFPAAEFSVDSFFWLSGFLVTYLTVQELQKKGRVNWFLYYFHRVWRLSPAYFYALFFYMCISVYMSDGPMWVRYMEMVKETCGKYWWTNLLYINNFIPNTWNQQCFLWGWYLAVDMQLYIVAPIVFLLYAKVNKGLGWAIIIAGIIATTVTNGVLAHRHHFVWNTHNPALVQEYMTMMYGKPYTRAAPWLLGIACGFLHLEKRPLTNRLVVYVGWLISAVIMLLCVYGPSKQFTGGKTELQPLVDTWNSSDNLMYYTFSKLGWSLALSFLMYSMAQGWGGVARRFLGAPFWNPLARLTYSTYLLHPIIMFVVYFSHRQYFSYDPVYMAVIFVGMVFLSFCAATVMFLVLERPMTNMEKLLLPHKKH